MAAAARMLEIIVVLLISMTLTLEGMAQSDCRSTIGSLSSCYDYVSESNPKAPSLQCCQQLGNVLQTHPRCLCGVLDEGGLNKTRLLELPKACNLKTPPVSGCYSPSGFPAPPPSPSGYSTKNPRSLSASVLAAAASLFGVYIVI